MVKHHFCTDSVPLQGADIEFDPYSMVEVPVPGFEESIGFGLPGLAGKVKIYFQESMKVKDAAAAATDTRCSETNYWRLDASMVTKCETVSLPLE